jgi:hypothetical protein
MQNMLIFLLWTIIFWMAGNCVLKIFYIAIQEGQMLDLLFGWQKMLANLYGSKQQWKNLLGKALGDCEMCTAFWFMPAWYALYWLMSKIVLHQFITDRVEHLLSKVLVGVVWYLVFHSIGAICGLLSLTKLKDKFKTKKDEL